MIVVFALVVLFETWIWGGMMAVVRRLGALFPWIALKQAFARLVDFLPAWAILLIFGVPFVVNEIGSLGCVILGATGHIFAGALGYIAFKVIGFGLIAAIFDLTRDKLLTMPWFVFVYEKFLAFHHYAHSLVAPYQDAAVGYLRGLRARARAYLGQAEKETWPRMKRRAEALPASAAQLPFELTQPRLQSCGFELELHPLR